jgi:hypothetical protein
MSFLGLSLHKKPCHCEGGSEILSALHRLENDRNKTRYLLEDISMDMVAVDRRTKFIMVNQLSTYLLILAIFLILYRFYKATH